MLEHSPYSPNLLVGDFLFQSIITKLRSKQFLNDQVMKEAIQNFKFFPMHIHKLVDRWSKHIMKEEDCVQKQHELL